ncbi:MAG TPA: tRNA (adenosine(37)-N6)-threonylcarbamoyltransferase complex ATPase subunit type 1 TsaE [Candidatus Krumholzibacteria bacterium]|nr:tRNA (adenosine(37)-N6)-threonylcarbamoyltransferase complex ATPase subunit type 1 TsaE [Candidatus Krumholzibacteria bacterium]
MEAHVIPAAAGFRRRLTVRGAEATFALGARAAALAAGGGAIVLLHGPLGAGKTCFCQGFCRALGAGDEVVSPTFTLVNTYPVMPVIHHIDFYRIEPGHDLDDIGVPDLLDEAADGRAVVLAEWPGPLLPALGALPRIELLVLPGTAPDERVWHARGVPDLPADWAALFPEDGAC